MLKILPFAKVPVRRYVPGDGPVPKIQTEAQILQIPQPTPTRIHSDNARACPWGCVDGLGAFEIRSRIQKEGFPTGERR